MADAKSQHWYAALLRGINIGGRTLPMPELARLFRDAGCEDVSTYIQSGNVVFRATADVAAGVAAAVEAAILAGYGFSSPVIIRSRDALVAVAANNPFLAAGAEESHVHVYFLKDRPAAATVAALDPERSPGHAFAVRDRDIYLHCPTGFGQTKLTNAWFDSKLKTVSTARNWRTVLKLVALMAE